MPAKNNHELSEIGVFEYIQDNRGIRYQCNQLARAFHCGIDEMRAILGDLTAKKWIETASTGRVRLFFIRTAAEQSAFGRIATPASAGQYRQTGSAWAEVMRKLADFRKIPSLYAPLVDKS